MTEGIIIIDCKDCNVKFKKLPECKAVCPFKISQQYIDWKGNQVKEKREKERNSLDKWISQK